MGLALASVAPGLLAGCAPRVRQRQAQPPPMVEPRADGPRLDQELQPDIPEHSAPPPAYGNKVVMAQRAEPAHAL